MKAKKTTGHAEHTEGIRFTTETTETTEKDISYER